MKNLPSKVFLTGFAVLLLSAVSGSVKAAPIACGDDSVCMFLGVFSGNDVAPSGGDGTVEDNIIAVLAGLNITDIPMFLAKLDINDSGNVSSRAGPEGSNFSMTVATDRKSGTWSTDQGNIVAYMTVKASNSYALYKYNPLASSGLWSTIDLSNGGGNQPAISHISFWGVKVTDIPEPGLIILFFLTLTGLIWATRRRSGAVSV